MSKRRPESTLSRALPLDAGATSDYIPGVLRGIIALAVAIGFVTPSAFAEKKWRTKEACTLIENEANDGDSFHVRVNKRHYIFRLLFVDTPESESSLPERIQEQANYFGITPEQSVKIGKEARKFSADFLSKPFTVFTQFDDAMGRSAKDRDYALITGADGRDLGVALVEAGLARIHGLQEVPEDYPSASTMRMRLKTAESEAKKAKRGAWAYAGGPASPFDRLNAATPITPGEVTTSRSTPVYAINEPGRVLGYLTPGKTITTVSAEANGMVRVRFTSSAGQAFEGLCRRSDIGL